MTRYRFVTIAAAVAAALGGPAALAQQSGTPDSSDRVQQRDATGSPSGSPTQPPRSTSSDRGTNDPSSRSRGIPAQQSGTPDSSDRDQQRDATGNPSGSPTQPPRSMSSDRTMGHGQYGATTVRDVQRALQGKGYDVGPIDGVMGPRTESALQEFQQKQGLTPSGRIDQQTMSALEVRSSRSGG